MPDKKKMPQKTWLTKRAADFRDAVKRNGGKTNRGLPRSKTTVIREGESSMTSAPGAKPTVTGRTYVQRKPAAIGKAMRSPAKKVMKARGVVRKARRTVKAQ